MNDYKLVRCNEARLVTNVPLFKRSILTTFLSQY